MELGAVAMRLNFCFSSLSRLKDPQASGFPSGPVSGKESSCQCRRPRRRECNPWVRKIPWRRKWQPTPVFLPGESHGQRSLASYRPWGSKELSVIGWWAWLSSFTPKRKMSKKATILVDNLSLVIFKEMTPKKEVLLVSVFTFLLNKVKLTPKFPQVCILKRSLVPRACLP